jgi:hypothetical protein
MAPGLVAPGQARGCRRHRIHRTQFICAASAIADSTLFPKAEWWIFGANIPGRKRTVMFYMAGLSAYRAKLAEVAGAGYEGFELRDRTRVTA